MTYNVGVDHCVVVCVVVGGGGYVVVVIVTAVVVIGVAGVVVRWVVVDVACACVGRVVAVG